jgi:hypothetical protein
MVTMGWGVPPLELWTRGLLRMSLRPPPVDQKLHRAFAPTFWSLELSLWMIHITLHHIVRYFPTNQAGVSNPGDGRISYGTGNPAPPDLLPPFEKALR